MLWQSFRYFHPLVIAAYWIDPAVHFTYPGFSWVKPWPGDGMYYHVVALGILAGLIGLGIAYRLACVLFFIGFTYLFLLEQTLYLNHYYFVCLISFLMIFIPADRAYSLRRWIRGHGAKETVAFWSLFLLRAQMAIVYIFGAIAKLNADWFRGEPVRMWLADKASTPWIGPLFERPETYLLVAWGGFALDLLIVPLLLWRRTRVFAYSVGLLFHLLNAWFFRIGIFPWFSMAATTLFFDPDWPRRAFAWMRSVFSRGRIAANSAEEGAALVPAIGSHPAIPETNGSAPGRHSRAVAAAVCIYLGVQMAIPLRHWFYPGDVAWTEEGHQFSWRMKLRDKKGTADFVVTDPQTGESWIEPLSRHMPKWQSRVVVKRPELIRQFARYLADYYRQELGHSVTVRVHSQVSLNGQPAAPLVSPAVDLSREPYRLGAAPWVTQRPARPGSSS